MRSVVRFALCCAVVLPAPASAQGFFESLFGGPSLPRPPAPSQPLPPPVVSPYGYRTPLYSPYRNPYARDTEDAAPARTGAYRTLCVRMCDGFYWPISNSVPRSSFHRDANLCRASCGEEARLFYHPASQADVNEMVDLTGRAYVKIPTAFRYRKALNDKCKCKPDPWAQSELDRHRRYALNQEIAELNKPAQPPPPAEPVTATPEPDPQREATAAAPPPPVNPDLSQQPAERPEPIVTPRPRARSSEPHRPVASKGPPRAPRVIRPATQPLFGPSAGSKLRWPGD